MAGLADALSKEPNGKAVAVIRDIVDEIRLMAVAGVLHIELRREIAAVFALGLSEGPAAHAEKTIRSAEVLVRQVEDGCADRACLDLLLTG